MGEYRIPEQHNSVEGGTAWEMLKLLLPTFLILLWMIITITMARQEGGKKQDVRNVVGKGSKMIGRKREMQNSKKREGIKQRKSKTRKRRGKMNNRKRRKGKSARKDIGRKRKSGKVRNKKIVKSVKKKEKKYSKKSGGKKVSIKNTRSRSRQNTFCPVEK